MLPNEVMKAKAVNSFKAEQVKKTLQEKGRDKSKKIN